MLAIIAIYALLASTFVIAKLALAQAHPFFLIGCRMSLAGALMGLFLLFKDRKSLWIAPQDRWTFLRISFFHIYLAFSCEFWALGHLSSAKTNLIYTATPFIAATLSYFLLHERLNFTKTLGLVLGLIGLLPVSLSKDEPMASNWLQEIVPEMVLFVAVVSASYAWFDIKKMMAKGYSLVLINGFAMFIGGIASLITAALTYGPEAFYVADPKAFIKYVLAMIVISNFIFYNAYGWLMKRYSITFLTFAGFLSPIFGALYGKILLKESIGASYALSLAIVTLALYVFYKDELKSKILASCARTDGSL